MVHSPTCEAEQDSQGIPLRETENAGGIPFKLSVNSHCFAAYKTRPCLALSRLPLKLSSTLKFQLICMQVGSTRVPQEKSSLFFLALYRAAGCSLQSPAHHARTGALLP